jgi:hypothetical protein
MIPLDEVRERYMRDPVPVRLGGIAANLARIRSCSARGIGVAAVADMLRESVCMLEWTAIEAGEELAGELVELQIQLALWSLRWPATATNPVQRVEVSSLAGQWSDRLLAMSGLLA